jgi:tripartite-type tricarboxylate transporter receptor subunit TctC
MKGEKIIGLVLFSAFVFLFAAYQPAIANDFPTKPIKVYVGFSPGGGTDLIARSIASVAPEFLGQALIIINKAGASGTLAAKEVANAKPDGYTLLVAGGSETTSVGHYKKLPYHPINAFVPVIRIARARMILCVNSNSPWKSIGDLVADVKATPGRYQYASTGHGGIYHSALLAFSKKAGIEMKHVPYKGGSPGMAALMGGHVDLAIASPAEGRTLAESGKIRMLAMTSNERSDLVPDVPTLKELGYDIYLENQKGFVAPAGTPPERVKFLHDAFKKAYEHEAFVKLAKKLKIERGHLGSENFRNSLQTMYNQIGAVVK